MKPRKLGAVTAAQLPQITHVTDDDGDVLQVAKIRRIEYDVAGRYVLFLVQWPDGFKGYRRISLDSQVYLVGGKATARRRHSYQDRRDAEITELRAVIARLRDGRDLLEEKNTLQERRLDDLRDLSGRLLRGGGDDFHDGLAEAGKQMRICMSLSPQPPAPEAGDRIAGLERENAHVSEQLGLATAGEDIATDLLQQIYDYQAGYILEVCLPALLSERIGEFLMAPQPPAPEAEEASHE